MRIQDLKQEITSRQAKKSEIRRKVEEHFYRYYGIPRFFTKVDEMFEEQKKFQVCLARQVPNANLECLAQVLFAQWLDAEPIVIGFTADAFCGDNDLKKSYCRVPFLKRTRKGVLNVQNQNVVSKENRHSLNGRTLREITTIEEVPLPQYHLNLREKAFGDQNKVTDVSELFRYCAVNALLNGHRKPPHVYTDGGGKEMKKPITLVSDEEEVLRPPADWYYLFSLAMFLDGDRALLSTVGDSPTVQRWFSEAIEELRNVTGYFTPLIISTPDNVEVEGYTSELLEVPLWPLQLGTSLERNVSSPQMQELFEAYRDFEEEVLKKS